jgi:hypothetical protein
VTRDFNHKYTDIHWATFLNTDVTVLKGELSERVIIFKSLKTFTASCVQGREPTVSRYS